MGRSDPLSREVRPVANPMADQLTEELLTPTEVARMFRVGPKTVTRWATTGRITSIRTPGGRFRFRESAVRALLKESEGVDR
jgi:excisionase family DNA binding protein